jgi:hypothetical protein
MSEKTINEQVAEYVDARIAEGATSITISEIQRTFSLGFMKAREILDSIPAITFNSCCCRYSANRGVK